MTQGEKEATEARRALQMWEDHAGVQQLQRDLIKAICNDDHTRCRDSEAACLCAVAEAMVVGREHASVTMARTSVGVCESGLDHQAAVLDALLAFLPQSQSLPHVELPGVSANARPAIGAVMDTWDRARPKDKLELILASSLCRPARCRGMLEEAESLDVIVFGGINSTNADAAADAIDACHGSSARALLGWELSDSALVALYTKLARKLISEVKRWGTPVPLLLNVTWCEEELRAVTQDYAGDVLGARRFLSAKPSHTRRPMTTAAAPCGHVQGAVSAALELSRLAVDVAEARRVADRLRPCHAGAARAADPARAPTTAERDKALALAREALALRQREQAEVAAAAAKVAAAEAKLAAARSKLPQAATSQPRGTSTMLAALSSLPLSDDDEVGAAFALGASAPLPQLWPENGGGGGDGAGAAVSEGDGDDDAISS